MHDRRPATLCVEAGLRDALLIRGSPDHYQLLFAGNSLIYDDLSQAELQRSLGHSFLVHTAGVPGSTYYDWSYGLQALFARGSRPDVLVFSISPTQFLREPAVTAQPVSLLWSLREILAYQREQRPTLTEVTELVLEHYSTFYALRNTIRIYVRKVVPGYEALVNQAASPNSGPSQPSTQATKVLYAERLRNLAAKCGAHTQMILMFSPTNQLEDERLEPALKAAAQTIGIPIIAPVAEREWPVTQFRDDRYHLTQPAAAEFSKLVATDLRQKFVDSAVRVAGQ